MKQKTLYFILLFVIITSIYTPVMAINININELQGNDNSGTSTDLNEETLFELVNKKNCEININDKGTFTRELTNFDEVKKEIEFTLTTTNSQKKEELISPVELFLVLDNSSSMITAPEKDEKGILKKQHVEKTALSLIDNLFKSFSNIKIGLVTFSGDLSTLGTLKDANLLSSLSNSKEIIQNKINEYANLKVGSFTNIEAGLTIAENNFSKNTNSKKYIILISDGVPQLSLDTTNTLTFSGSNSLNTKNKLKELSSKGIDLFSILTAYYEKDVPCPRSI